MLPKFTAVRQAGQSILGDVRREVGKVRNKGGEIGLTQTLSKGEGLKSLYKGNAENRNPLLWRGQGEALIPVPAGSGSGNCRGPR